MTWFRFTKVIKMPYYNGVHTIHCICFHNNNIDSFPTSNCTFLEIISGFFFIMHKLQWFLAPWLNIMLFFSNKQTNKKKLHTRAINLESTWDYTSTTDLWFVQNFQILYTFTICSKMSHIINHINGRIMEIISHVHKIQKIFHQVCFLHT